MLQGLKLPKLIRWIFLVGVIFLILLSLLRLGLFLFFNAQGNELNDLGSSFFLGLRYDLRDVSILLLLLLIFGSIPPFNPFRSKKAKIAWFWIFGLASLFLVFFYVVDFAHYSYLAQRLNASVLNYLSDAGISINMVWQTYPVIKILVLPLVATWMLHMLIRKTYRMVEKKQHAGNRKSRLLWFILFFLFFAFGIFGRVGQYPLRWSDAFALGSDYRGNLALNPFQSFFSSLKFRHSGYDSAKVKKYLPVLAPYFGFRPGDSLNRDFIRTAVARPGTITSKPNVIVVICESFSAYKSSMWGNPLGTTPFFNGLCEKGIFFDHCFTPTYGTARGVWAVITGMPDVETGTTTSSRNPAAVSQRTIINDFSGYKKYYFLGGSTSWANIRGLLTHNIDSLHLYEGENFDAPKIDVWGISDKNLFLESNKVLSKESKPFFAIIQTADNHRPYTIPKEDQAEFHPVEVSTASLKKSGFESLDEMNAFRYTDFCYQKFIEAASKEKYFENTVFLFIGDHGIPGDAGTMFPRAWTDQRLTAEHVPMLIYSPKWIQPKRISGYCSQVDVLPTLAGLTGVAYTNTALGRDLLDSASNHGKELSFIYDPDQGYIGVLNKGYYYRKQLKTGKEEMISAVDNQPVSQKAETEAQKSLMRELTEGIYETSKYLLLNNRRN